MCRRDTRGVGVVTTEATGYLEGGIWIILHLSGWRELNNKHSSGLAIQASILL
jgi:hypothetical protein